jgi:hypothetical protein
MIYLILFLIALCWLSYEIGKRARSDVLGFWALIACVLSGILLALAVLGTALMALVS